MKSTSSTALNWAATSLISWLPHKYQLHAIKFLLTHGAAALFLDPGLGKTSIVLSAFSYLLRAKTAHRMLVVAPLRVCYLVWPREIEKWKEFNHLRIEVLHGPRKEEALEREADIYVINPEGLEWLSREGRFKRLGADTLVLDESSKFKKTNTQRFKTLKPWLPKFSRRWILTGTPAPNGLMDLFGQIYVLDLGRALGPYVTHFRAEFFTQVGFDYVLQPGAEERIHKAIKPMALRLRDIDHIDVPSLQDVPIYVDLPESARKVYSEMENRYFSLLDSGEPLTASTAGAAYGKCRQIASGGIYRDTAARQLAKTKLEEWIPLHEVKTDAMEDLVEELAGQPLLIGYEFNHDLDRLRARFGKDMPYIGKGVSEKRTIQLEAMWNRGELPILAGHPGSIGHGLNLQQACNHVAWYSIPLDLELYDQFIRRVKRQGNKKKIVLNHLVIARDTLDLVALALLSSKDGVQGSFLGSLSTYRATKPSNGAALKRRK